MIPQTIPEASLSQTAMNDSAFVTDLIQDHVKHAAIREAFTNARPRLRRVIRQAAQGVAMEILTAEGASTSQMLISLPRKAEEVAVLIEDQIRKDADTRATLVGLRGAVRAKRRILGGRERPMSPAEEASVGAAFGDEYCSFRLATKTASVLELLQSEHPVIRVAALRCAPSRTKRSIR